MGSVYNAEYHRAYNIKNREMLRAKRVAARPQRLVYAHRVRMLRRAFVDAAHADGCVDCGNKNLGVLQSDHVRGVKVADVGVLSSNRWSLQKLFAELDKCETRCANCHTLATANRRRAA